MSPQSASVERTLRRAVLLPIAVAALIPAVFLTLIMRLLGQTELLRHTEEVIVTAEQSRQLAVDMETGQRGFLLTRERRFLEPYDRAVVNLPGVIARLKQLVADNPEQLQRVSVIERDIAEWQRSLSGDDQRDLDRSKSLMDGIRARHDEFLAVEHTLSQSRTERVHQTTRVTIGVTIALAIVAGAVLVVFTRRQLRQVSVAYEGALAAAETAATAKDRMLAAVSHELRTPLTSILGWTVLLRREQEADADLTEMALSSIEQSARLQARVVEDLIDVSRAATGSLRMDIAVIDVRDPLGAVIDAIKPAARAKGVTVEASVAQDELRIAGDTTRLQQVFWNLLSNALRYTPADGRVDVAAEREKDTIVVRVKDTGPGIDPAFLPHVFDAFTQQNPSARSSSGLGLGLAIARQVIELHGGTIAANSEGADRGTEFVVRLPAAR
jgi:signal transduction histidine kinase